MANEFTTIQITKNRREQLANLRYGRETYDELIGALLQLVPSGDDEGNYSNDFRSSLVRGLLDIRHGRTYTSSDVRQRLGIKRK